MSHVRGVARIGGGGGGGLQNVNVSTGAFDISNFHVLILLPAKTAGGQGNQKTSGYATACCPNLGLVV